MHAGLIGWVSAQQPSFSFRKSFCTTDRGVVQNFSQLFLSGKSNHGKKKDCVALDFTSSRAGGGVWIFGLHDNNQTNKSSIGYPLSVFNIKLYSLFNIKLYHRVLNKVSHWHRKKSNVCFNLCVRICVCTYVFVRVDMRARMCAVRVHTSTQAAAGTCRTHLASYSVEVQLSSTAAGTRLSSQ